MPEWRVRHRQPKGTVTDGPLLYITAPTLDPTAAQEIPEKRRIDMAEEKGKTIDNDEATEIPAGTPKDKQLSDEDLERVAGGAGGTQLENSRRSATGGGAAGNRLTGVTSTEPEPRPSSQVPHLSPPDTNRVLYYYDKGQDTRAIRRNHHTCAAFVQSSNRNRCIRTRPSRRPTAAL